MKSNFTFLVLLLAIFASCKKTNNVDIKLSNSGKLSYKLTDATGKGLPNVKISLFDRQENYSNFGILLDTRLTDFNGQADFGDLNPSNYMIIADSPKVNNVAYYVQEYVQVTTGTLKLKEVKVTDFSGTFNLTVKSYNTNQALKNIGVLIIPANKFNYSLSTTANFKIADFAGLTNDAGSISLIIPSNKQYVVYLYNSITNTSYNNNSNVWLQKDGIANSYINLYN